MLLIGSDGGMFATTQATTASGPGPTSSTWTTGSTRSSSTRATSAATSHFAANPSAVGGAQDNGPSAAGFPNGGFSGPVQWNLVTGGDGFLGRIDPVGSGSTEGQYPRYYTTNNGGALSRCVSSAAHLPPRWRVGRRRAAAGAATPESFVQPFDIFHGGIPGGDDCAACWATNRLRSPVDGTTASGRRIARRQRRTANWYITNNPDQTDQGHARQPLVHQPGQVLAEVATRRRSPARTTATSGSASTSERAWRTRRTGSTSPARTPSCRTGRCSGSRSTRRRRRATPRSAMRRSAASTPTRRRRRATSSR